MLSDKYTTYNSTRQTANRNTGGKREKEKETNQVLH